MLDGAVCVLVRPRAGLSAGLRPSTRDQVRRQVEAEGAPPPSGTCSLGAGERLVILRGKGVRRVATCSGGRKSGDARGSVQARSAQGFRVGTPGGQGEAGRSAPQEAVHPKLSVTVRCLVTCHNGGLRDAHSAPSHAGMRVGVPARGGSRS